jgi:beta-galactosidase/beta-glucuronidase
MAIPRPEYPRPQFVRPDWLCLNGEWQFEIDYGDSGRERGLIDRELKQTILVPFCPESRLSGIEHLDFLNAVWYRRTVSIPEAWAGKRVLLHFQAVDYETTVWVNGEEVARHQGGFSPFTADLYGVASPGEVATIVVRARDNNRDIQPRGKQSTEYAPHGAHYVRTTGIWQTVWMEPVPDYALRRPRITPDVANSLIRLEQSLSRSKPGLRLRAVLRDSLGEVATAETRADADFATRLDLAIPADRRRLWTISDPHLYDLDILLLDENGTIVDQVASYAGLRSVSIEDMAVRISGEVVFQRLVLDQGFYPDGILTAPSDDALQEDIRLSMEAGFNGARLHQKVFEERFLYHADRLGYLVWGEFPDWGHREQRVGVDFYTPSAAYITEWLEVLERDYSHPAIIGWCPLNETWESITDRVSVLDTVTRGMFLATKAMDTTRPVIDASGGAHRVPEADIYDAHDYDQNADTLKNRHGRLGEGIAAIAPWDEWAERQRDKRPWSIAYRGQPFFLSEFGGIWWNANPKSDQDSWGYGERPKSLDEFYERFEKMFATLLDDPYMFGYCYTQLTDVYQEQNGIYTFDRRAKFDMQRIKSAQQRPAAIELKYAR